MPESTSLVIVSIVLLVGWAVACFGVGKLAEAKGRSFLAFFLLALVLTPFLAGFLVLLLGTSTSAAIEEAAADAGDASAEVVKVRCAECGEAVDETCTFCPKCGRELVAAEV